MAIQDLLGVLQLIEQEATTMDRMNKIVFNDVTKKYLGSDDMASNSVCCLLKAIGDALKLKHNQSLLTPGYKWKVFNKLRITDNALN